MSKRNALGRGLSSILGEESFQINNVSKIDALAIGNISKVKVVQIEPNPHQPRTEFEAEALAELAESIKIHGVIQPLTVRKLNRDAFQLISGERRLRASKLAGLLEVPVYIIETDNQGMIEMALIENIQRENLNAVEIAISYQRLMDECGLKHEELGDRVGKNRATVSNYLRLLKLPPAIQVGIKENKIQMGHARALIAIPNAEDQLDLYYEIIAKDLSVRKVEELSRALGKPKVAKPNATTTVSNAGLVHFKEVKSQLESKLETRVMLNTKDGKKGDIVIPFGSVDDLNKILEQLLG